MTVNSFVIEGISNINSLRLDIGSLNALIAPNGYGKSNVLRAIDCQPGDILEYKES